MKCDPMQRAPLDEVRPHVVWFERSQACIICVLGRIYECRIVRHIHSIIRKICSQPMVNVRNVY